MPRILLASSSPYRRQLLERLCLPFAHQSPDIDETPLPGEHPRDLVERLARLKAAALGDQSDHTLVIGSDQATAIEGEILGKPLSHDRAHQQLARASGRTLVFHTGLAVLDSRTGKCWSEVVDFQVRFRPLDAATIDRYLLVEQPYDCAGSFKAEGLGIALFEAMQGDDPTSLIGLPLIRLTALLREAGLQVP
ncbi:Maf family protein [Pseudomonas sp. Marseille-Q7302]